MKRQSLLRRRLGGVVAAFSLVAGSAVAVGFGPTNTVGASDGTVVLTDFTAPNLVGDSNVTSNMEGPDAFMIASRYCNTSSHVIYDVQTNVGTWAGTAATSMAGEFEDTVVTSGPYTGTFDLNMVPGVGNPETRLLGSLDPAECVVINTIVSYDVVDASGNPVWGVARSNTDDLVYNFDYWVTWADPGPDNIVGTTDDLTGFEAEATDTVTVRNQISANANKIETSTVSVSPPTAVGIGETVTVTYDGVDFGSVNQGYDSDGDGKADYDLWFQGIGESALWDPDVFQLVGVEAAITGTQCGGGRPNTTLTTTDITYFKDLDVYGGCNWSGTYSYIFIALAPGSSTLAPYQEAASGSDNEKYNGDYCGDDPASSTEYCLTLTASGSSVALAKSVTPVDASPGDTLTWSIDYTNSGAQPFGDPDSGYGLAINDQIPAGLTYVGGSATCGVLACGVYYSVDGGSTFSAAEPATPASVTTLRWIIDAPVPGSTIDTVSFQTTVDSGTSGLVDNTAAATIGSQSPPLATASARACAGGCADLAVDKDSSTSVVPAGGQATYTIVVQNLAGALGDSTSVAVTDTLPAGFTYASTTSIVPGNTDGTDPVRTSVVNPTAGATAPVWAEWTLQPGDSVTVTFIVDVAGTVAAGTYDNTVAATQDGDTVTDDGTAADDGGFPVGTDPEDDDDVTVAVPTLTIDKDTSTPTLAAGGTASYTVVVANTGLVPAIDVTIADTFPAGWTYVSSSATESSATRTAVTDPTVGDASATWGTWDIAAGGSVTLDFDVLIPLTATDGVYDNTASANAANHPTIDDDGAVAQDADTPAGADPATDEDVDVVSYPVLGLTKTDSISSPVAPTDTITYTIVVSNTGFGPATNVVVTDSAPTGTTFVEGSATTDTGTVDQGDNPGETTLAVNVGALAASTSATITFKVTVDSPAAADLELISNIATAVSTEVGPINSDDPDTAAAGDAVITPVNAAPVLHIAKSDGPDPVEPGGEITYSITYGNTGNQAASGVVLTETVPTNTTYQPTGSDAWVCSAGGIAGSTCTLAIGPLAPGTATSGTAAFVVTVGDKLPTAQATIANTIDIDDDSGVTARATASTTVNSDPVLVVTKVDAAVAGATVEPGENILYTVTIDNSAGTAPATGVVFTDTPGTNTTLFTATPTVTSTQGTITSGNTSGDTAVAVNVGTIAVGSTAIITFEAVVDSPLPAGVTEVENSGIVRSNEIGDVRTDDPDLVGASNPTVTSVNAAPDVTVDKVDNEVGSVAVGATIVYTISATNIGNQAATAVVISETVPTGTTFAAASSATEWSCDDGDPATTVCTLDHGALAGGDGTVDYAFAVTVDATAPSGLDNIVNTVSITDPNDSDSTNNTAIETTPLAAAPVLEITKSDGFDGTVPGATDIYVLRVRNIGDQDASDVVITETVPANTTFDVANSTAGWACSEIVPGTTECTFTIAALAAVTGVVNVSFAITVDDPVAAGVAEIANTATITAEGGNNGGTLPGPVTDTNTLTATPDLTIVKADGGATIAPAGTVVYELTVTNNGNQDSSGSIITETVPANATFASALSTSGWSCADGALPTTVCTFTLGTLAGDGGSIDVNFAVTADSPIPAGVTQLSNSVSVADDGTNGADPTDDNTATDTTPLSGAPDLSITKDDSSTATTPGSTIVYALTIDNGGTRGAELVVITETVPVGTTFDFDNSTAGWSCADNAPANTECTFALGTVEVDDAPDIINFAVTVDTLIPSGLETIVNAASVADDETNGIDPDTTNNSNGDTNTITAAPDLRMTKGDGGASVIPGETIAYTLLIENIGNQASAGSVVSDVVPDFTVFSETNTTAVWTCADLSGPGTNCESALSEILAGDSITIDFVVGVDSTLPAGTTAIANSATVTDNGANGADTNSANDTEGESTPIGALPAPLIEVAKTDTTSVNAGGQTVVTYTVDITNAGNLSATNVQFVDTPDANTTLDATSVSVSPSTGTAIDRTGGVLTVDIAEIAAQVGVTPTLVTITFDVIVTEPLAAGIDSVSNQGTVTADGLIIEPTDDPDTAATDDDPTVTPIGFAPDLVVTKTDNDVGVAWGDTVVYEVSYSNVGRQDATGVEITETIPAGTTFNAALSAAWDCTAAPTCVFAVGALGAGDAPITIDFAVDVPNPVTGGQVSVLNAVSIADDGLNGTDETPADNNGDETTPILTPPALTITKTGPSQAPATTIEPGDTITYTLAYENTGQTAATGVAIVDVVPTGTVFVDAGSNDGFDCTDLDPANTTCTLTLGPVAEGASGSVAFVVRVLNPTTITSIANAASIDDDDTYGSDVYDDRDTYDVAVTSGRVGDRIWIDANENGAQDAGEFGAPAGTVVQLRIQGDPTVIAATTTGTNGAYSFDGLPSGVYTVTVVVPTDYAAPSGTSVTRTLAAGLTVATADIALNKRGSLGDSLFYDLDGNGTQNGTEPGLAGVTVELLDAAGDPVTDDGTPTGTPFTATTGATGNYRFDNVLAGDYQIRIVAADLPANAVFTTVGGDTQAGTVPVAATPTTIVDIDTIDFGVRGDASLGDQIFIDLDADGAQAPAETTGVADVIVELLYNGVVVATDISDVAGAYDFTNLLAGTHEVRVVDSSLPAGAATSTTLPLSRALTDGDDINDADIGVAGSGSIGDRVWYDADADGIDNNGETGLGGVVIILEDADGVEIERTTSAPDGTYTFNNLPPGTYVVVIDAATIPAGGSVTLAPPTAPIVLGDGTGGNDNTIDAIDIGITGTRSVGDLVYFDTNGNGIDDLAEIDGIGRVTVELLDGTGPTAAVIDSAITAPDGSYSFDNLFADTYGVRVVTSTLPTGVALTTAGVVPADATTVDVTDADFGATGTNSIGDLVFFDADGDDLRGANEPGIGGVTLRLLDDLGNPLQIDGADVTATTASNGSYSFDRVPGGSYSVQIVSGLPTGAVADNLGPATVTVVSGDDVGTQDFATNGDSSIGDIVFFDADENELQDVAAGSVESGQDGIVVLLLDAAGNELDRTTTTTVLGIAGSYLFDGLIPGTYRVAVDPASLPAVGWFVTADPVTAVVALPSGTADLDIDFGITARGSIGDQIWIDADGDGVRTPAELNWTGAAITIALLDTTGAAVLNDLGNAITTTTGATGEYVFDDVPVGDYQVRVVTATLPANYSLTSTNDAAVSVAPLGSHLDIDFGINAPGSISGEVFADLNESGIQDPTETQGVQGVLVALLDAAGNPVTDDGTPTGTPIAMLTGIDGSYRFTNLAPGDYQVEVMSLPRGYVLTTPANSGPVAVAPDTTTTDVDFGANAPGTIGDVVYYDLNGNGTRDPGEPGLGGITVELLDDTGNSVDTQVTAADGSYDFTDVNPGDYTVQLVGLPANTIITDPLGATIDVTLLLRGNVNDADFGLRGAGAIGDEVFVDANANGVQDGPLEVGRPNVELILSVDAAGDGTFVEIARTISLTADGLYDFTNLFARDYQVTVNPITIPAGYALTTTDPLAVTVGDGGIGSPADIDTADIGINAFGTIIGTVFIDADEINGQDRAPGSIEVGQPGVVVELRDAAGNSVLDGSGAPITAVTDADGDYTFTDVPGGTYTIRVQIPGPGSPLEDFSLIGVNDLTAVLPVGGSVAGLDFGFNNRGSIGDRIWIDGNSDHIQDVGEPNAAGSITVRLLDPNDGNAEVASFVSTDGTYLFDNLLPGDYIVQIDRTTLPSGFNLTDPTSRPVRVPVGDDTVAAVTDADFGINSPGVIGDTVFYDVNGDGIQQPGEPGLDGVTVTLTPVLGPVQNVTTSLGGGYTFTNLLAGDYVVSISDVPDGSRQTVPTADGGTYVLALGVGEAIDSANFGLTGINTVGGAVWSDTNGDGIHDGAETGGVGGVAVTLLGPAGNVVATTETAPDGTYSFPGLFDATYSVSVDPNTLPPGTLISTPDPLTGLTVVATGAVGQVIDDAEVGATGVHSIGDRIWFDLDADGIQDPTEPGIAGVQVRLVDSGGVEVRPAQTTGADGTYDFTKLPDGTYTIEIVGGMPADGIVTPSNSLTVAVDSTDGTPDDVNDRDIAVRGTGSIGDTVFVDPNANGVQDLGAADQPDETVGLGGITVELLIDAGAGPVVVGTTITATDGTYNFPNLLGGTYDVRVGSTSLPVGTSDNTGTLTVLLPASTDDDTVDFGVSGSGVIGGTVYIDLDSSQTRDGSPGSPEVGLSGVVLVLTDDLGNEIARTTSGVGGVYSFENVIAGDYEFTIDPASVPSANYNVTTIDPIEVTVGDGSPGNPAVLTDADIGINAPGIISGKVFIDANEDGTQAGPLEIDQGGITMILRDAGGVEVARIDTNPDGTYSFEDVLPGRYTIAVDSTTLPAGFVVATPAPSPIDLALDGTSANNNVGLNARGSIGDQVWIDLDGNGLQSGTETAGLRGVTVDLVDRVTGNPVLDDAGNAITAVTNSNGQYLFIDVLPGDYSVVLDTATLAPGYATTTSPSIDRVLGLGDNVDTIDFGVNAVATIAGTVFWDIDGNADRTGTEPGLDGVSVELVDSFGTVVATAITSGDGTYGFDGVNAGNYTVRIDQATLPVGATLTTPADAPTSVDLGDAIVGVDFGANGAGAIGDTVFVDANADGIQDTAAGSIEPGSPGRTVILRDGAGTEIDRTVTGVDGVYSFDGLFGGSYTVELDPASIPVDNVFTTAGSAADPLAVTVADSGAGAIVDDADIGLNNPSSIGGSLYVDADSSGTIDPSETDTLSGVTVDLLDAGGNIVATTTTGLDGSYNFADVPAGTYVVQLDVADLAAVHSGYDTTLPSSQSIELGVDDDRAGVDFGANNPSDLSGSIWVDVNNDDVRDAGETTSVPNMTAIEIVLRDGAGIEIGRTNLDGNGDFTFTNVPAGTYTVEVDESTLPTTPAVFNLTAPNGETVVLGVDDDRTGIEFGVNAIGVIGDTVWFDTNGDGIQNPDETYGLEGIDVVLFDALGNEIDRVTTVADGQYRFIDVTGGDYSVGLDLSARPDLTITNTGVVPIPLTLGVGAAFLGADFGVQGSATIGDEVFFDIDGNGIDDTGDVGQPGIVLVLRDVDGDVVDRQITDGSGNYAFTNIPAGAYTIEVEPSSLPLGYTLTTAGAVSTPFAVAVADGSVIDTADVGVTATASIGGTAFVDVNGDGVQDPTEVAQPGVDVVLLDSAGDEADRTITGPDGTYTFSGVDVGTYGVAVDPSTLPDATYIVTTADPAPVTVGPNDVVTDVDIGVNTLGSVTGIVFLDLDGDGVNDPTEPGQPGVDVVLIDAIGNEIARVTVGPGGTYTFPDVLTGDYVVRIDPATLPLGAILTTRADTPVVVPLGADVIADDIGVTIPGTVSGVVFLDPDRDGRRVPGDLGYGGVTVVLVDGFGAAVATTTSGPDGTYNFPGILPGDYTVAVFPVRVAPTGPIVIPVKLSAGQAVVDIDFGVVEPATISGTVFLDTDSDAVREPGEPGAPGVVVRLHDADGTIVATTVSGPDGGYSFTAFPGVYTVDVDSATFPPGTRNTTPTSATVDLTPQVIPGQGIPGPDFGLAGTGSIGDTVFADANGNGVQDPDELGLAGVTLTLLDGNGNVLGSVVTDDGGMYGFNNRLPGTYTVRVDGTTLPGGYVLAGSGDIPLTLAPGANDLAIDVPLVRPSIIPQIIPRTGGEVAEVLRAAGALLLVGVLLWLITRRRKDDDELAIVPASPATR